MNQNSKSFLETYLSSLPKEQRNRKRKTDSFRFCLTEKGADLCANLVKTGCKRATASLEWCFTVGEEKYPEEGELDVVTNWNYEPQCIIEITAIEVKAFNEVDKKFAFEEGEGNKSLELWREVHWKFFSTECRSLGLEPNKTMPIVLQRFTVVYPSIET